MIQAIHRWRGRHPDLYEFILFNLLANIATITNFLVLLLGNSLLFRAFSETAFVLGPFDYSLENGGLCGFLSFLLSYACAQTVNFIVQRKAVFHADTKLGPAIGLHRGGHRGLFHLPVCAHPHRGSPEPHRGRPGALSRQLRQHPYPGADPLPHHEIPGNEKDQRPRPNPVHERMNRHGISSGYRPGYLRRQDGAL